MALKKERSPYRTVTYVAIFFLTLYVFGFFRRRPLGVEDGDTGSAAPLPALLKSQQKKDFNSLFMTEKQCRASFPLLNKEIEDRVANGHFKLDRADDYMGLTQGRIKDGKIYIISASADTSPQKIQYRDAALHQLHRAIITSPEPLPDTIFALCVNDFPRNNTWSFAKWDSPDRNDWLMPHFSFWSWPQPYIGSFDDVLLKIDEVESAVGFHDKIAKAVWRGTSWFNPIGNKLLRSALLTAAKDKPWADVEALKWETGDKALNALKIEDFCKYKYIIYTEGVTYSGRLHYHQACTSVIITPPPTFMVHTTHMMRPVFSSTMPLSQPPSNYLTKHQSINRTWPHQYTAADANVVFVAPDWSDLEATIEYLESNPDIALGIAKRGRIDMLERGYFSPAAEVCYWRSLIRRWSETMRVDESEWPEEGMRWETFTMTGKANWT